MTTVKETDIVQDQVNSAEKDTTTPVVEKIKTSIKDTETEGNDKYNKNIYALWSFTYKHAFTYIYAYLIMPTISYYDEFRSSKGDTCTKYEDSS